MPISLSFMQRLSSQDQASLTIIEDRITLQKVNVTLKAWCLLSHTDSNTPTAEVKASEVIGSYCRQAGRIRCSWRADPSVWGIGWHFQQWNLYPGHHLPRRQRHRILAESIHGVLGWGREEEDTGRFVPAYDRWCDKTKARYSITSYEHVQCSRVKVNRMEPLTCIQGWICLQHATYVA